MPWWGWLATAAILLAALWFFLSTRKASADQMLRADIDNASALEELAPSVAAIRSWIDKLLPDGEAPTELRQRALDELKAIEERLVYFHSHRLDIEASRYTDLWLLWNDVAQEMWEHVPYDQDKDGALWTRMQGRLAYAERVSSNSVPSPPAEAYRNRPLVPVESLYSLINPALDLVFNFEPFSTRLLDYSRTDEQRRLAFSDFENDLRKLQRSSLNLRAVRVSESESAMMLVQIATDRWLTMNHDFFARDGEAHQSLLNGNRAQYLSRQHDADRLKQEAKEFQTKVSQALKQLSEERPDQFAALKLSDNNLIDMGLKSRDEWIP